MTISAASTAYANYARTLADMSGQGQRGSAAASTGATETASGSDDVAVVSLSAAARAVLAGTSKTATESRADMLARTKTDVAALLKKAGSDAVDLTSLDRRQLFAVAANLDNSFDPKTVEAAKAEMKLRLGDAMRGPVAAAEVTGKLGGLYSAADAFLDAAGPEEQASDAWKARKAAVDTAEKRLKVNPDADTSGIANDPVSEYFAGKKDGSTDRPARDFAAVAKDARALMDSLKKAAGTSHADTLDLSKVDGRALAAMALNEGNAFDPDETRAAKQELRARSRADLIASMDDGSDPRALSLGIVSQYAAMSAEERAALGWTGAVQANAVSSYEQTSQVLNILSGADTAAGARLLSLAAYLK